MTRLSLAVGAALLLAASSCEKGPESTEKPSAAASATTVSSAAPAVASAVPPAPGEADDIPVAADFEEEAEKTITKANYKAELDALEAELKK